MAVSILSPLQVGVGVSVGCESIVHSLHSVLQDASIPPESRCTLLVDFSNAFNCIDRASMFEEARARIPSMSPWLECCYASQPQLLFGEHTILSCSEVQQGDPLGPLGFALTLHPILERIKQEVPDLLLNSWYLDDGTLCGYIADLCAALAIIEEDGPARGLFLNRSKSLLYVPAEASCNSSTFPPGIPCTSEGFVLLGAPFGPAILERVQKIQKSLSSLKALQHSQMQTSLMRSCLALPKISFALRTCHPQLIQPALVAFDNSIRGALSDLVGGPLPEWSWLKASLPSSLGGLGLRRALFHAPAAFIGSLRQANFLMCSILGHSPSAPPLLPNCISALSVAAGRPEWLSLLDIDVPLTQRALSKSIDMASFDALLNDAPDTRSRALLLSSSIPHACDWLNVIPSSSLGLHFLDREFRVCLQYWLGLRIFNDPSTCAICQSPADPFGDHHVGCGGNNDRISRHDSIRDAVFSAAQSAALAPRCEERKIAAHAASCRAIGVSFVPLAFESLGGCSKLTAETLAGIGRAVGQRLGIPPPTASRQLFQRCSVSLWRGNATLWLHRFSTASPFIDCIV